MIYQYLEKILINEGINLPKGDVLNIIESSHSDIRQVLTVSNVVYKSITILLKIKFEAT